MSLADQIIEHGPYEPGDGVWPFVARVRTMAAADLNALRDELIELRKLRTALDQFEIDPNRWTDRAPSLDCRKCFTTVMHVVDSEQLADLVRRAEEHTEDCR